MPTYYDHPTEEALERFLLHQCLASELDTVETHILACESCVARLETLEVQIAVTKTALQEMTQVRRVPEPEKERRWTTWFKFPVLSWAAAGTVAAALAIAAFIPAQVSLSAYRGTEISVVPQWRPLAVHLNASGLGEGLVATQLVNAQGTEIWRGNSAVSGDRVELHLPRLTASGNYFLRLYEPPNRNHGGDLLREFTLQVK